MAEHKMRYLATRQAGDPLPEEENKPEADGENSGEANRPLANDDHKESAKAIGDVFGIPGSRSGKEKDDIWVKKEYLLFDLDGTLTDPKLGITTCVQYALKAFGIDEPDLDRLEPFIGPPLLDSFKEFYGFDDEKAQAAIEKYRERFRDKGIFENEIYRGVPDMLKKLKQRGLHLGVASS